jgi:hypothetical protein
MCILRTITTIFVFSVLIGCATGSYIITGKARPAISPTEVKVYPNPPSQYETIGIVEASSDVGFSTQAAQDRAIEELKKQAAKIGANGVILTNTGNRTSGGAGGAFVSGAFVSGVYGTGEAKTARAEAIYVVQE